MPDHRKQLAAEVAALVKEGRELVNSQIKDERAEGKAANRRKFGRKYQSWYSRALPAVEQLLPERYVEFRELYRFDKEPKRLTVVSYVISDYIHGTVQMDGIGGNRKEAFDSVGVALGKAAFQVDILASAEARLKALITDIEGTLEASLLDDELETATELLGAKHLRSAGVLAGVVLERHLATVIANHEISYRKKRQIGNLNNALKEANVYDVAQWRQIQRFGDIRNLCGHDGEREPSAEEVEELIRGTEKIIATVF